MKIYLDKIKNGKKLTLLFNVMFQVDEDNIIYSTGWRVQYGLIYPPATSNGKRYYKSFLMSPKLAEDIYEVVKQYVPSDIKVKEKAVVPMITTIVEWQNDFPNLSGREEG